MPAFRDNKDREWELFIDAPTAMKIRNDCDQRFLLNDNAEDNTYARLAGDPVLLCRVVYLLCEKQRKEREVSEESFYREVLGKAIDRATEAMLEAIINFTPARIGEVLQAVAQVQAMQEEGVKMALAKVNDPQARAMFLNQIAERLATDTLMPSPNATPSPDSSESTPPD